MALPELEITLNWVGLQVVDSSGSAVGSVEAVFADAATEQAEWALVATDDGNGSKFVPLLDARQDGDDVRVAFDRTAITGAPVISAPDELTEDEEAELYTHYGLEFDTSGSVLPQPDASPPDIEMPPPPTSETEAVAGDPVKPDAPAAAPPKKGGRKKKDAPTEAMPAVASSVAAPLEVPAIVPPVDAAPAAALAADVPPPAAEPEVVDLTAAEVAPEPERAAEAAAAPPVTEFEPSGRPTPAPAWEPVPPTPKKLPAPAIGAGVALVLLWLWRRRR